MKTDTQKLPSCTGVCVWLVQYCVLPLTLFYCSMFTSPLCLNVFLFLSKLLQERVDILNNIS